MKHVGAIRKELGFRTVFNILGPLTNPGTPSMQLLGVYDEYLVEPLAQVLIQLGIRRGMVVYGQDKLDEISMSAPTTICEIRDGWFKSSVITPEDFGFERCTKEDLKGGAPEEKRKNYPCHSKWRKRLQEKCCAFKCRRGTLHWWKIRQYERGYRTCRRNH